MLIILHHYQMFCVDITHKLWYYKVKSGTNSQVEVNFMAISYLKLWKLLLDKSMKKTDLIELADISTTTLAKLSKNQPVSMEVMWRICKALSCDIGDIMEMIVE